jgi:tetratricopeptide (TPR) repeat protein
MLKSFFQKPKIYLPTALIVLAAIVYFVTKPPSILWIDSGTMLAASYTLGIPNPPGFPFYMLASHIFAIVPFANVLTRLEFFTIFFSLIALYLIYRIILLLIESDFFFARAGKDNEDVKISVKPHGNLKYLAAFFGAISLAFSYQYWSQSQNTEAFIFTDFFLCLFLYILLSIQSKKKIFLSQNNKGAFAKYLFKTLFLLVFLYGLAAGANPTIAALVPGVLFVMYLNRRFFSLPKIIVLGLVFLATLIAVYAYLPLRASVWPFVNWGNPQTWQLFVGQLRGEGLNIYEPQSGSINGFTGSPIIFLQSVSYFFYLLLIQFTPLLLPFLGLGLYFVYKKNRYLLLFLMLIPIVDVFYAGLYYSGNQESWFILSFIVAAIFIGVGFYYLILRLNLQTKPTYYLFLLCFLPLIVWFVPLNRSNHYYAEDYARNLYSTLGKNAILIGTGDFSNSLGFYLHEADKYRPDVTPVTANVLYVNKWYRDDLRHAATKIVVSPKLENIIQYKAFDEYNRAMNSFIADNINKHPIYVTHLTLRASALAATSGGQLVLDSRFKFIPHGLSLQVVSSTSNAKPDLAAFDFTFKTPNPQTAPFYLERNYNAGYKNLANDYAYSWEALGDWYLSSGDGNQAFTAYKKADAWSPNNPEILSRFGQYYGSKKELDVARQYFQEALDLSPDSFPTRYNLAVTLADMGRRDEALQQFNIIQEYAAGSSIALDARNQSEALLNVTIQTSQSSTGTKVTGNTFVNQVDNYSFVYPNGWTVAKNAQGLVTATNGKFGKAALNLVFFGKQITTPQRIDDFVRTGPLKQPGTLLDIQNITVPGLKGFVEAWGQAGSSSQIIVVTNDKWAWQIAVSPGDPSDMSDLYSLLNTFKVLR